MCSPSVRNMIKGILLKEWSSPYHHGKKRWRINDIKSDHSFACVVIFRPFAHVRECDSQRRRLYPKRASRTTSCTDGASPLKPATSRSVQQGRSERTGRRTSENCAALANASSFDPVLQDEWEGLGFGVCQSRQELCSFATPQAAHFRREDHQGSPSSLSWPTCLNQDLSVMVSCSSSGRPVASQGRDQCRVDRQLCTVRATSSIRQRPPPNVGIQIVVGDQI